MRSNKTDYPNRKYVGFSDEQLKLLERASEATGNTLAYLIRKWCENGAKRDITETRRNKEN